jgi:hypothetical protein
MKTLCTCGVVISLAGSALGQGQFSFRNYNPALGVNAPVFDTDCQTRLEGGAFLAQVYAGASPDQLQPLSDVRAFHSGAGAGYMAGGVIVAVPGTFDGQLVYAQMRAWEAAAGQSFEAAVAAGGKYGFSNIVPVRVSYPPGDATPAVGVESFCLVPEPATLLLFGCGAAALAVHAGCRSRKLRSVLVGRQATASESSLAPGRARHPDFPP